MIIWHLHDPGRPKDSGYDEWINALRLKAFGYDMWINTIELHGETKFELYSEWHKKTTVHGALCTAQSAAILYASEIDAFRKKDIAKTLTEIREKAFFQTPTAKRELCPIGCKWERSGYSNLNPEPIKQTWYRLDLFDGTPGKITRAFCARSDDLAIEDCVDLLKTTKVPNDTAFLYRDKDFYPIRTNRKPQ